MSSQLRRNFWNGALAWGDHHPCLFKGTEWFFRTGYRAHLPGEWIPALDGVEDKLTGGARVADVGCGHGASIVAMANAYPAARFWGFDYHGPSIETARQRAKEAGVNNAHFEVADATSYAGRDFDLIARCFRHCLNHMVILCREYQKTAIRACVLERDRHQPLDQPG